MDTIKEGMQYVCYKECCRLDLYKIDSTIEGTREELYAKLEEALTVVYPLGMITPPVIVSREYCTPRITFDDPKHEFEILMFNMEYFLKYFKPYSVVDEKDSIERFISWIGKGHGR